MWDEEDDEGDPHEKDDRCGDASPQLILPLDLAYSSKWMIKQEIDLAFVLLSVTILCLRLLLIAHLLLSLSSHRSPETKTSKNHRRQIHEFLFQFLYRAVGKEMFHVMHPQHPPS